MFSKTPVLTLNVSLGLFKISVIASAQPVALCEEMFALICQI